MNIHYYEFPPAPHLAPHVECYWVQEFDGEPAEESPVQRCVPLGMLEVLIHPDTNICDILLDDAWEPLPRAFFHGIYSKPVYYKMKGKARIFGIRFKPETFSMLFNVPAASFYCNFVALEAFFGKEIQDLHLPLYGMDNEGIVEHCNLFLSGRLEQMKFRHHYITRAADMIRRSKGNISIGEVSNSIAVSMRQLQRGFKESMGTSPKGYLRIIRFRNALTALEDVHRWADITYALGYADQAHFIREFKEFSGEAPNGVIRHAECFLKKPLALTDQIFFNEAV
ncbi:AraC family transcriptional regulator [Flavobacterium sp. MFBS3-15]|uniref:helix-turn-helix domain-containing protein n=1 Tax=Flavobacterium sp. MFBS3-15 TaxID=2989816 RepID=UPI002236B0A8|nr:AraC family transcriptional regulator [Flavobacterium sp. MFBS3-15]MCW4469952.1 AraC family transcriptional regulator [Flavobacterium sp. MFBS3-15]